MNKTYANILAAASYKEFDKLKKIYYTLLLEKKNTDKYFTEFLEKTRLHRNSPQWITYNKKCAEYGDLLSNIKAAKFFMEKYNV